MVVVVVPSLCMGSGSSHVLDAVCRPAKVLALWPRRRVIDTCASLVMLLLAFFSFMIARIAVILT